MGVKEDWIQLAGELGFEFKEGIKAFTEAKSLYMVLGSELKAKDLEQAQKFLANPLVQGLLSKLFIGAATGRHEEYEFFLLRTSASSSSSGSGSRRYYVNVALLFNRDLRCGLDIVRADFWTRLGKKLFSGSYVRLPNNPELDGRLSIKAKDQNQAKALVFESRIQAAVGKLFDFSSGFQVSDHGIRHKEPGHIIDRDRALRLMDMMAEAAKAFG